ncbi:MAG: citrate synthase family protein [Anaerolineae bacterium]
MTQFLSAKEAADALGISLPTLYSYVSRGMIRSEAAEDGQRQRRYYAEDVEKLLLRKEAVRHPEKLAETALNWGAPVLESALTLIQDNQLFYRGHDAARLAVESTLEAVAALLWTGERDSALFAASYPDVRTYLAWLEHLDMPYITPLQRLQMVLPLMQADDLGAYDLRPDAVVRTGVRLLHALTLLLAETPTPAASIAETLQRAWCPDQPEAVLLLNAALILCADHELNVSSFTARVVASSGATPYTVIVGALSAFQGVKHGGAAERVAAFLREIDTIGDARRVMADRLRRGELLPGFGHKLYPEGDVRATTLFALLQAYEADSEALVQAQTIIAEARQHANIDLALVILCRVLRLPMEKAALIFALGRMVGWIGHALEQYQEGSMIRPRARYTGVLPSDG